VTHPSPEDHDLVSFLRQHRSNPPPAAPDLEDQILQALPARSRRHLWIVPSAIAASLVGAIVSYQVLRPTPPEPVDTASIESFMESNWVALHDNSAVQVDTTNYLAFDETIE
jgi:ferric-dicitrate binding protein FerR (iron transport regulator)